ncbi:MAG: hypothetical protein M3406_01630 [Chloroflexota bacterium]|nr:hypothetical protein [Chloroflexota bacterium]
MRRWRLHLRSDKALTDLARIFNVVLQGWINYYGRFYKPMLDPVFRHLDEILVRWAMKKYKRLRRRHSRARRFIADVARRSPACSRTGVLACAPTAGRWEPGEPRGSRRVLRAPGVRLPRRLTSS